jgi:hypothetical protein
VTSFIPIYDRTEVRVGLAQVYLAPYDLSSPAVLPADTVALGGAWPSSPQAWVPIGATEEGVKFIFQRQTENVRIEEQMTPVDTPTTEVTIRIECAFAEDKFESIRYAAGGGTITTQAAASGVIGKKTLVLASDLTHYALGLETKNKQGFFRRMLIPDVVSVADISSEYRRAATKRMYAAAFNTLVKPEDITIIEKTANALP